MCPLKYGLGSKFNETVRAAACVLCQMTEGVSSILVIIKMPSTTSPTTSRLMLS